MTKEQKKIFIDEHCKACLNPITKKNECKCLSLAVEQNIIFGDLRDDVEKAEGIPVNEIINARKK